MTVKLPDFTVTDLRIINDGNKLAQFNVAFNTPSGLLFRDLRLLKGQHGYFVTMPARRSDEGEYYNVMQFEPEHQKFFCKQLKEKVVPEYESKCEAAPQVVEEGSGGMPF